VFTDVAVPCRGARRGETLMRHVLAARVVAARPRGMGEAPRTAGLVASSASRIEVRRTICEQAAPQ